MHSGCAKPSDFRLEQPRLAGPQCRLDLLSEQVWWTEGGGVHRVLAEVPLPGAGTGRAMYLLYLRITLPPGGTSASPASAEVRGFLIQTRGRQAGLTPVTQATVSGSPPGGTAAARWNLRVDLQFEDGSQLSGDLIATRENWRLRQFEERTHAADVQALLK